MTTCRHHHKVIFKKQKKARSKLATVAHKTLSSKPTISREGNMALAISDLLNHSNKRMIHPLVLQVIVPKLEQ